MVVLCTALWVVLLTALCAVVVLWTALWVVHCTALWAALWTVLCTALLAALRAEVFGVVKAVLSDVDSTAGFAKVQAVLSGKPGVVLEKYILHNSYPLSQPFYGHHVMGAGFAKVQVVLSGKPGVVL